MGDSGPNDAASTPTRPRRPVGVVESVAAAITTRLKRRHARTAGRKVRERVASRIAITKEFLRATQRRKRTPTTSPDTLRNAAENSDTATHTTPVSITQDASKTREEQRPTSTPIGHAFLRGIRAGGIVLLLLLLIGSLLVGGWYARDAYHARHTSIDAPVRCAHLAFASNRASCAQTLTVAFAAAPLAAQRTVCGDDRAVFLLDPAFCDTYDATQAEQRWGASLRVRGVSPWMPSEPILMTPGDVLVGRTMERASSATLVCDGAIIGTGAITATGADAQGAPRDAEHIMVNREYDAGSVVRIAVPMIDGNASCILIANVPQGVVTSEPFLLVVHDSVRDT